jgi:hypothetical protein
MNLKCKTHTNKKLKIGKEKKPKLKGRKKTQKIIELIDFQKEIEDKKQIYIQSKD